MKLVLDALYLTAALALSPLIAYRVLKHNRYRRGWAQRCGRIVRRSPEKRCLWLHAVSVGEVNAAQSILAELAAKLPDAEFVVSTTTDTGFARAQSLYGDQHLVTYFPFDLSPFVERAFAQLRPCLCLLMELEIWPNFMKTAHHHRVPVLVVNGRISDKSFVSYRRVRPLIKSMFSRVHLVLAQTEEYAARFVQLGCAADKVIATGSLKYDTAQVGAHIEGADSLAARLDLNGHPVWVAGGTGVDEEVLILEAFEHIRRDSRFQTLRLVIVPRKPERFDLVAELIHRTGMPFVRYSRLKGGTLSRHRQADAIILGDTMGDLRKFYSLATVVFVGRSLVPMGGSDMMEVAALGKPTLFGPHTFNFRQTVDALLKGQGALEVTDAAQLTAAVTRCLLDPDYAAGMGQRGQEVIRSQQGATARCLHQILKVLDAGC